MTFESKDRLTEFVRGFEAGTWPYQSWTHAAHVAMAAWYLQTLPEGEVVDHVRKAIRHYNECVGVPNTPDRGYHETLTVFWLDTVGKFLKQQPAIHDPLDGVLAAVAEFGEKRDLFRRYYSFDVVASREARATWMAPDRQPQV